MNKSFKLQSSSLGLMRQSFLTLPNAFKIHAVRGVSTILQYTYFTIKSNIEPAYECVLNWACYECTFGALMSVYWACIVCVYERVYERLSLFYPRSKCRFHARIFRHFQAFSGIFRHFQTPIQSHTRRCRFLLTKWHFSA